MPIQQFQTKARLVKKKKPHNYSWQTSNKRYSNTYKVFNLFSKNKKNYKLIIMGKGKLKIKLLKLCKIENFLKVVFKNFKKSK